MKDGEFRPRLGRMRQAGSRQARKYLHSVLAAAARAGGIKRGRQRAFSGVRLGRGGSAVRALSRGDRYAGFRSRRAIVKTRLVRLSPKAIGAARAHLRYIQRDGASRDEERGLLYSAADDRADGKAFMERCSGDRHQFRFIVSAEDGAEYDDLRPLIRRFMARMEEDLGTALEWVAADHRDTLHPHTHIILRGKDERGENLVIAPDYIKRGMRERLAGLVSIDLGPRSDLEIERRLRLDVHAERLTAIDRQLLRGMDSSRTVIAAGRDPIHQAVRAGRLRKLGTLGLADELGGGRWRLSKDLEPVLRRLSEEGDITRTLQRELGAAGIERAWAEQVIFRHGPEASVTGRVVSRGLADELGDRHYLVIDAIDGRSHYVEIGNGGSIEPLPEGAIVEVASRLPVPRETDDRIASVAASNRGRYSARLHQRSEAGISAGFAETHVRRLEAIRRSTGGVERLEDGSWSVPPNFLELAARHEAHRLHNSPVELELLSAVPLESLPTHDGATWLDRSLLSNDADLARDAGFGREVRAALALRQEWLLEKGLASMEGGALTFRDGILERLQAREVQRAAETIGSKTGLEFLDPIAGSRVEGIVRRRVDLASGRFAMIENGREFSLVPWRPVLERAMGRRVSGIVRSAGSISWAIGRDRGLER